MARNTKAKIARTKKNYGVELDAKISVPKLDEFKSRKEYNEWKENAQRFTNRYTKEFQFVKNDYGVVTNKQRIYDIQKATEKAQIVADKKNQKVATEKFYSSGKEEGTVGQQMKQMKSPNAPGISRPDDFDFKKVRNPSRLNEIEDSMKKRANPETFDKRTLKMKITFERELEETFNSDAQELLELIEDIPLDDFYYLYLKNREFDFQLFYIPDGIEDESSLKDLRAMERIVRNYWEGKENMDLKGF